MEQWIKTGGFGLDPSQPDPGRVTIHRLNRVEYKNTIRDLMGVDFETKAAFPDDDSGYGFDNIADVLNMSPLLMEKYLTAAQAVVGKAVPVVTWVPVLQIAGVDDFKYPDGTPTVGEDHSWFRSRCRRHPGHRTALPQGVIRQPCFRC